MLVAGLVGRAHGLDGSFYVVRPRVDLLGVGAVLTLSGRSTTVVRRAGTDARPIVRLASCGDRGAAVALHGQELIVAQADAPPLGPDEYSADQLVGARVVDGGDELGVVRELIALPSCECLAVTRVGGGADMLVPLVRDAIRVIDVERRVIEVNRSFLGE
ncbi:MAG TPA: ribosome maturation factor RimM [Solirubrobacteraceae bacterium]|jgi:16S rRNA processing protein RimM|nr:ribosome maturation factor RimM [Solirubrobacteraceae bacterium]